MNLGNKLYELRKKKGISQEEAGDILNVSRQTISKWETNQSVPDIDKLVPISKLYGISADDLLDNEIDNITDVHYKSSNYHYEYRSNITLFNIPLVHINVGRGLYKAKGIIAIGSVAIGIISIGFISIGLFAIGIFALALLALGAISVGVFALGAISLGLLFALGGIAIGYFAVGGLSIGIYSLGGCAIASNIALGGYANAHIAIGDIVNGKYQFQTDSNFKLSNVGELRRVIITEFPHIYRFIVDFFVTIVR